MKKRYLKVAITFISCIILFYACKKETIGEHVETYDSQQMRDWYSQHVNKTESNLFSSMEPDWNKVSSSDQGEVQVFEITLQNPKKIIQVKEGVDQANIASYADKSNVRLIIFKSKKDGNITTAGYMSVLSNNTAIDPGSIHYKKVQNLNGKVLYYHINGEFNNGWQYNNGVIVKRISVGTIQGYLATKQMEENTTKSHSKLMSARGGGVSCSTEPVEEWRTECVGVEGYMRCDRVRKSVTYLSHCVDNGDGGGGGDGDGGYAGGGSGGSPGPSPAAVFIAKIDDTKIKPCMKTILTDINALQGGKIPDILKLFSGSDPIYNWTVQDGTLPARDNAQTSSHYDGRTRTITSTFDSNKFSNASDLSIARTIMHESVHAYLVTYFTNDPVLATADYPKMAEAYFVQTNANIPAAQHDLYVNNFIGQIATALTKYGDSKGYQFNSGSEKDQFYNDLAWGGLTETQAFKNLPLKAQQRISDTINAEQFQQDAQGNAKASKGQKSGC